VEVGQGLVLVHLGHAKLLNQQFLHILKLVDFIIHFLDLLMTFVYPCYVIELLLVLDHPLTLHLHMDELSFAGIYFVPLLALFVVIVLFLTYSLFKEVLLLGDHHTLHTHRSLLNLKLGMPKLFSI
jgi:hypothetical protein